MAVLPQFDPQNGSYAQSANGFLSGMEAGASIMERKQRMRLNEQRMQQEQAEFVAKLPLLQADAQLTTEKARASVANGTIIAKIQTDAAAKSPEYIARFNEILKIPDWSTRADELEKLQVETSWLSYLKDSGGDGLVTSIGKAREQAEGMTLANAKLRAEKDQFTRLIMGMTPEEQEQAKRVKAGLQPRISSAAITYQKVVGPDGREQFVAFDPRAVGAQVIGSGQTYGSGVSPTAEARAFANGEAPVGENRFISQTPYEKNREETEGKKDAEYKAKLRQEKPKREAALNQAEALTDQLTGSIDELISKVSAGTAGPGGVLLSKFPGSTARDLQANLDSIKANIGFQALQAMREASPTGGALGNISDTENKLLQARFGALEIGQSPTQLVANLKKVRQRIIQNYAITRGAFANEYGGDPNEGQPDATAPVIDPSKPLTIKSIRRVE